MTIICQKCGLVLLANTGHCSFCEVPVQTESPLRPSTRKTRPGTDRSDHEWRREVTRRLGDYRASRRQVRPEKEIQSGLPFRAIDTKEGKIPERPRVRASSQPRQSERVDICIQPELDFSSSPDDRAHPQTALVPVASLAERRSAGMLDALFISLTGAGFVALFHALGGEIILARMDAVVGVAVFYLFYCQYFFLFTNLLGATPGMQIRGLTVVRLDGSLPDTRQLLWRSFGYLLSGATVSLGFLWALWDEDHFTWQDRISRTYITSATPFGTDST